MKKEEKKQGLWLANTRFYTNIFSFRYSRYAGQKVLNMRCCEAGRKEEVHREDNCLDKVFIFLYALFLIPWILLLTSWQAWI